MKEESRSPGEMHFHYNRDERMAKLPEHIGQKSRRGFLRGNRSLIITLLDVLFLVILVVIFSVVMRMQGDTTIIPGFSITARAVAFDDRVLVSIKAVAKRDHEEEVQVRIRLGYEEIARWIEVDGFLPAAKGEEQVYRSALDIEPTERKIVVYFYSQDNEGSMSTRVTRE